MNACLRSNFCLGDKLYLLTGEERKWRSVDDDDNDGVTLEYELNLAADAGAPVFLRDIEDELAVLAREPDRWIGPVRLQLNNCAL